MVFVMSKDGQMLMPTERHGKVRRMLRAGKAKVVKRCPFTIQLLYDTTVGVQKTMLTMDAQKGAIMDYNLVKNVSFYSGNEVSEIEKISDRILYGKEMNHWVIYSGYLYTALMLCIAYEKLYKHEVPVVRVSDLANKLAPEQSVDLIKEYILTASMTYLPVTVYSESREFIMKFLKTKPKEAKSILDTAKSCFMEYFLELNALEDFEKDA